VSVAELRAALLEEGGTLAESVVAGGGIEEPAAGPPQIAARGPRAGGQRAEYELLLEMILEGSLLHYGAPRVVRCADPDLALLLGDQLYALGLARLAALGDLDAVAELADLISLLAQAQANSDPGLAEAIWQAGATAIGWGPSPAHEQAKALARVGDSRARGALEAARATVVSRTR
jgi:hypothetical protein